MYPGNKKIEGVYQKIISLIPPCKYFVEGFAGSASISRIIKKHIPAHIVILNDIDYTTHGLLSLGAHSYICHYDIITFLRLFLSMPDLSKCIFFFDPPYLHSTRPSNTAIYNYEMSIESHSSFLSFILDFPARCILIHPTCEMYDDFLSHWNKSNLSIRYHNKTSLETIYYNFPHPTNLLIDQFTGKNFTDRQRIKRKAARIVKKISSLPPLERSYILNKIKTL